LLLAALAGLQARRGKLLLGRRAALADQLAGSRHAAASLAGAPILPVSIPWRGNTSSMRPRSPGARTALVGARIVWGGLLLVAPERTLVKNPDPAPGYVRAIARVLGARQL